jgi:hypothetical protein
MDKRLVLFSTTQYYQMSTDFSPFSGCFDGKFRCPTELGTDQSACMELPGIDKERFNRRLKEECGDRNVMVRGAQRVMSHRMFGVISLFADHLLKLEIS